MLEHGFKRRDAWKLHMGNVKKQIIYLPYKCEIEFESRVQGLIWHCCYGLKYYYVINNYSMPAWQKRDTCHCWRVQNTWTLGKLTRQSTWR